MALSLAGFGFGLGVYAGLTFARLALGWMGFCCAGFCQLAFSFRAGLASSWLALAFLPSWLLGLIGFGWLWAGLAFTVLAFCGWFFAGLALSFGFLPSWLWAGLAFCFCRVGFGLGWVGFGLAGLGFLPSWLFAGLALGWFGWFGFGSGWFFVGLCWLAFTVLAFCWVVFFLMGWLWPRLALGFGFYQLELALGWVSWFGFGSDCFLGWLVLAFCQVGFVLGWVWVGLFWLFC